MSFYYQTPDGQSVGPVTAHELLRMRELNVISETTFVAVVGERTWVPYAKIKATINPGTSVTSAAPPSAPRIVGVNPDGPPMLIAPNWQGTTVNCPNCQRETGLTYDLNPWSIGLFVLGLIVPLWPITLPLFWILAYVNRRGTRRCGLCKTPM